MIRSESLLVFYSGNRFTIPRHAIEDSQCISKWLSAIGPANRRLLQLGSMCCGLINDIEFWRFWLDSEGEQGEQVIRFGPTEAASIPYPYDWDEFISLFYRDLDLE